MSMKYVAAYLMAVLGGNEKPGKKDVEKILSAVGITSDGDVLGTFMKTVEGKTTHEVIAKGMEKLQSMPCGGGGAAAAGAAPAAGKAPAKEEKKEEPEEEEEADLGFSLFD
eukprot:GHVT01061337.1.p9 GENE.GHVT01061337.1~~GHVT01061337.1.p9  ORF type:complete len:111 (+),score=38.20 GHVT01061337.1:3997-4329(+)